MFSKILVANRGEIAIRAFRAGYEIGAKTVAVFPQEDRNSIHRQKADEAYLIGEEGHPVRAYLDVDEIVRVAKDAGCDAIYPGYGFLSENPNLARAAADAGITFVGPPAEVLELAGNKVRALEAARQAGIPVLKSSKPSADLEELVAAADEIGFPIFAKAVAGGGGRGMRRVDKRENLREALEAAMREADSAFGDPTMFLEQAVLRPRHIEVQILADGEGNVMHLFERDCSLQRRHQKVIEIAPAPNLDENIRQALYRDAVAFAKALNYVNAGTVEFLVDTVGERAGQHVFIEMNPRIQVEHTVTEEVTDVDLVQSQLRIAAGETLADLGLSQDSVRLRGAALQSRITTEDPANGFRPDVGKITAYRSAGGAGVRLDGGTVYAGAEISPHFDSMLVKLTCRGRDYESAVRRARRALAEFRVRGVSTNISFLQAVLDDNPNTKIVVPGGVFKFTTLTLSAGQVLIGVGRSMYRDRFSTIGGAGWMVNANFGGTVLRSTATTGTAIVIVDPGEVTEGGLRDLSLVGPGSGTSVGVQLGGISPIKSLVNAQIHNVLVGNFATGAKLSYVNEGVFVAWIFRGCTTAVEFVSNVNHTSWTGLEAQWCGDGIIIPSTCYANAFESFIGQSLSGTAVEIGGAKNSFSNAYLEAVVDDGFRLLSTANANRVDSPTLMNSGSRVVVNLGAVDNQLLNIGWSGSAAAIVDNGTRTRISGKIENLTGTGPQRLVIDPAVSGSPFGPWQAFTPAMGGTGWALGDAAVAAAYTKIGRTVHFRIFIVFGSTSTYGTASPTLTLPVTPLRRAHVDAIMVRNGVGSYRMSPRVSTDGAASVAVNALGTNGLTAAVTATHPATWAASDTLEVYGTFEAAA